MKSTESRDLYQGYRFIVNFQLKLNHDRMNKKEKAKKIAEILDELYPNVPIPLKHRDPFTLLVAVVLSAQCTDKRVNEITPKLFERAPSVYEMALLPVEEIEEIIRSCGLYKAKSKNISQLSKIIVDKYNGKIPETYEELESLPGVGHKSASVVMSQAYGHAAFPVDTHIHRLAYRWGLSDGRNVVQTEKDLKRLFPKHTWNKLHLQIIYFGREYCPARNHDYEKCPICSRFGRKELLRNQS